MKVPGLSDEQRFIIAYDAARTLSLMIVRACGFRPKTRGGHYNTFKALVAADAQFSKVADYFDTCRVLRNESEYDYAGVVTRDTAEELVQTVVQFHLDVESWISAHHLGF